MSLLIIPGFDFYVLHVTFMNRVRMIFLEDSEKGKPGVIRGRKANGS